MKPKKKNYGTVKIGDLELPLAGDVSFTAPKLPASFGAPPNLPGVINCKCLAGFIPEDLAAFKKLFEEPNNKPMRLLRELDDYIHNHIRMTRSDTSAKLVVWMAKRLSKGKLVIIRSDRHD